MTTVRELYNTVKTSQSLDTWPWDEQLMAIVRQDPNEMAALVDLFENETNPHHKMLIAGVLAELSRKEIIPFSEEVIKNSSSNPMYRHNALYNLLMVDYQGDADAPMWIFDYINDREGLMTLYQGYLCEIDSPAAIIIRQEIKRRLRAMGETLES